MNSTATDLLAAFNRLSRSDTAAVRTWASSLSDADSKMLLQDAITSTTSASHLMAIITSRPTVFPPDVLRSALDTALGRQDCEHLLGVLVSAAPPLTSKDVLLLSRLYSNAHDKALSAGYASVTHIPATLMNALRIMTSQAGCDTPEWARFVSGLPHWDGGETVFDECPLHLLASTQTDAMVSLAATLIQKRHRMMMDSIAEQCPEVLDTGLRHLIASHPTFTLAPGVKMARDVEKLLDNTWDAIKKTTPHWIPAATQETLQMLQMWWANLPPAAQTPPPPEVQARWTQTTLQNAISAAPAAAAPKTKM